jgi:ABC-type antimicrobial peptide transport system permease subunit
MFNYSFLAGNAETFQRNPYSIVLTKSKARKFFGNENALGRIIKLDTINYVVAGVVKDNPLNTSFGFDIFLQYDSYLTGARLQRSRVDWNNANYIAFVRLRPDASAKLVAAKLAGIQKSNLPGAGDRVLLDPLKGMYLQEGINSSLPQSNKKAIYVFALLGILLLATACINYVNLTTARASLRAKEVGVRKITGAGKSQLFLLFLVESLIISFSSLLLAVALVQLLMPLFNSITEKAFHLPLTAGYLWEILSGTLLFATLLNGIYPALLLSSFKPLNVFRGKSLLAIKDGAIRKGLVVFQFALSILLITGTLIIYRQLHYIQTANPGYNISQVVSLEIPYQRYGRLTESERASFSEALRHAWQMQPGVVGVSTASDEIISVGSSSGAGNAVWDGKDTAYHESIARLEVDADFQKVFGLQLKSGRWFGRGKQDYRNVIINETAEAGFNMHKPVVGQRFVWGGDTGQVVGVVKDFHYKSMHNRIGPMVLLNNQGSSYFYFVKIAGGNIPAALKGIAAVWAKYIPAQPFEYHFLDDSFNSLYKTDIKTSRLIFIFAVIAIIISAMGLFGLATYTAERRTREIGIRKILGASIQQITTLLSKEFILLILLAIAIASPLAWWLMNKWLQDFAYRIHITSWFFIASGALALFIALLSVSMQAIKTAVANPAKSLRTD